MIVPMMKYSLLIYHLEQQTFLEKLSELGLVDITLSEWEPTTAERAMVQKIETYSKAIAELSVLKKEKNLSLSERSLGSNDEAFEVYGSTVQKISELKADAAKAEKEIEDLRVWGDFNPDQIEKLNNAGVNIRLFSTFSKEYDKSIDLWRETYNIQFIGEQNALTYFAVVGAGGGTLDMNASEHKIPTVSYNARKEQLVDIIKQVDALEQQLGQLTAYISDFKHDKAVLSDTLHLSKVSQSGQREAEGSLIVLEGWAPKESVEKVDQMLAESSVFYLKDSPTPEDNVPVLLKNNKFAKLFEMIGELYALPKYGSMDLTPFFAPFYMMFFGFCLGDAGYGLLYVIAAAIARRKVAAQFKPIATLVILCGLATIFFGILTGTFFGIPLGNVEYFAAYKKMFLDPNKLFTLALCVGVFQILFGMTLKVINTTIQFGFKYSLSTIGWMITLVSSGAAMFLPDMGVTGFSMSSVPYYILLGIGLFLMFFFNSPGRNPFFNFGLGLWNTYNDITGFMGDLLSYIRLFALGLCSGILALVFNDLAFGLSPDIPVIREIAIVAILLIGHGINLFMGSLSSFVHPLRLTFVEFYKNAGFESTTRIYTPLKKS